jgi:hypothetical protein
MAKKKIKITLNRLSDEGKGFIEIERHPDGSIYFTMKGQDESYATHLVRAQLRMDFEGTRNRRIYDAIAKLCRMI